VNTATAFDDLEDLDFAAPRTDTGDRAARLQSIVVRAAEGNNYRSADRSQEQGNVFFDPCKKCNGRGRFISYAGRDCGPCFTCKGKGQIGYKTPKEAREQAAARIADRKATARQTWIDANPAEWAWVVDASSRGFEFAVSLKSAFEKFGSLTENQLAAVRRMIAKRAEKAEAKKANSTELDVTGLDKAFAVAREKGAKVAVIRTGAVTFSLAKATGANPGAIYAKDEAADRYLGKIVGGKFLASFACTATDVEAIQTASINPAEAAVKYGRETGSCSICARTLTDPASIERGIGPICAEKFGW
jgi:Family of unknown function (DUF6011)